MSAPRQPIFEAAGRFWYWWTRELRGLLPSRPGLGAAQSLVIDVAPAGLRLIVERGRMGGRREFKVKATGGDVWPVLKKQVDRSRGGVGLRFPYAACFVRRVEIPRSARQEAGRFLALDLERATPFRSRDVYSTYFFDEQAPRGGLLTAYQLVLRRDSVDELAAEVRASGVRLAAIDCWNAETSAPLPVNFLPEAQDNRAPSGKRAVKVMTAAVAALAASAIWLGITTREAALAEVERRTSEARAALQETRAKESASNAELGQIQAILNIKSSAPSAVETLNALTRLLPDEAWVTDLRLEGDRVELTGEAQSAASLVGLLEASETFEEVSFTAPVTRDGGNAREHFSLRARISRVTSARPTTGEVVAPP